jgi:lipopolysaccharide biosynthesis protein
VLVIAHVFYPEIWPELATRIERIPAPYDVIVTLVEGHSAGLVDTIVAQFPKVVIETLPNRGRDIWPLVHVAELGLIGDYDAVLKLHTKKSVHRLDGDAWRERLLDSLCPTPEGIALILDLFRRDPEVGMVAPAGAVLGREFWGSNGPLIDALAARSGIPVNPPAVWFPGGSMFWSRPGPLNRLRKAGLTTDDFEHEVVTLDCTTAHALERFFGALVADAGEIVIGADEVAGRLARARANPLTTPLPELQTVGAGHARRSGPAAVA